LHKLHSTKMKYIWTSSLVGLLLAITATAEVVDHGDLETEFYTLHKRGVDVPASPLLRRRDHSGGGASGSKVAGQGAVRKSSTIAIPSPVIQVLVNGTQKLTPVPTFTIAPSGVAAAASVSQSSAVTVSVAAATTGNKTSPFPSASSKPAQFTPGPNRAGLLVSSAGNYVLAIMFVVLVSNVA
jgi:hypothetical protein